MKRESLQLLALSSMCYLSLSLSLFPCLSVLGQSSYSRSYHIQVPGREETKKNAEVKVESSCIVELHPFTPHKSGTRTHFRYMGQESCCCFQCQRVFQLWHCCSQQVMHSPTSTQQQKLNKYIISNVGVMYSKCRNLYDCLEIIHSRKMDH